MHLLAYWRLDNYLRDLDEGAGFNFNSKQSRLHSAIDVGETLWLFTAIRNPLRYFLVAKLVVRSKTINSPTFKYGAYRVWGDLDKSRYFHVDPTKTSDQAFELLRGLSLESGSFADCTPTTLAQACQTMRGVAPEGNRMLNSFARHLRDEPRALAVANEYDLERELLIGGDQLREVIATEHSGVSDERRRELLGLTPRNRQLVASLHDRYAGRCQLCAFDSPIVYGVPSAESHHLVYLSRGGMDELSNMVLLCPNHHTVVHKTDATFDYARLTFLFANGRIEPLCINTHLERRQVAH
jgi:5-methylcytosine-specific restriction endonuclease McrA